MCWYCAKHFIYSMSHPLAKIGVHIIVTTLQMRKQRVRKVMTSAFNHSAGECQRQVEKPQGCNTVLL